MEKLKAVGIPVSNFENPPLISLTGSNYKLATVSDDMKFLAVARSYFRKNSEIMDILLVRLKTGKEHVVLDTLTMIRYGRPNGILYQLYFNNQNQLIAKISDGMKGTSEITFDPEKREILKDEYLDDYYEEADTGIQDELYLEEKISDLKRIFPHKSTKQCSELAFKLMPVDTAGYIVQGILGDNSIYFLPRGNGKLRLMHNLSDPAQNDNIDGFWGTHEKAYYLLKDKKNNYFFRYDIRSNVVTLLEKYPLHSHYLYLRIQAAQQRLSGFFRG